MECRPFKDPNFGLHRMHFDVAIQALPAVKDSGIQATGDVLYNSSAQYEPLDLPEEEKEAKLESTAMDEFLTKVKDVCELALQQNEVTDIFEDEFASLGEEDAVLGNKKENVITEFQSFTDLTYSRNKCVSAIDWMPLRKGVVAVACTEDLTFEGRVNLAGRVKTSVIIVWNFIDPIHPQFVLESPNDVICFRFNPERPEIVAGGCYNGQVVLWDISTYQEALKKKERKKDDDDAAISCIKHAHLSSIEHSHHSQVTDIQWLKGLGVNGNGATDQKGNNFFVTLAADGRVRLCFPTFLVC